MNIIDYYKYVMEATHVQGVETRSAIDGILMSKSKKDFLPCFGVIGQRNLGDELLKNIVHQSFPGINIAFLCSTRILQRQLLRCCISSKKHLLVGGGTLLLSYPLRMVLEPLTEAGLLFATFGTGAHDDAFFGNMSEEDRKIWIRLFKSSIAIGVRGPRTKDILDKLGVKGVEVVGDPAIIYARPTYCEPVSDRIIGINYGTALGNIWGRDEKVPFLAISDAIRRLNHDGWKIRFFCVWPRDLSIIHQVASSAGIHKPEIISEFYNPEIFMKKVSSCRVFVGMKLHAVILAICSGVATIALEYQPKHSDFMASIDSEAELLRIDKFSGDILVNNIYNINERINDISIRQWTNTRNLSRKFLIYQSYVYNIFK